MWLPTIDPDLGAMEPLLIAVFYVWVFKDKLQNILIYKYEIGFVIKYVAKTKQSVPITNIPSYNFKIIQNIAQPGKKLKVMASETESEEDGIDCLPSWETRCLTMPCLTTKVALCNFYYSRALFVLYNRAIIPQPN